MHLDMAYAVVSMGREQSDEMGDVDSYSRVNILPRNMDKMVELRGRSGTQRRV
jgi:hypothetical protein